MENRKKEHRYYVYILASKKKGTLYIGVTNGLFKRNFQHKLKINPAGFTAKYNVTILVYYETYGYIGNAITREKQLKKWKREWKIELVEKKTRPGPIRYYVVVYLTGYNY